MTQQIERDPFDHMDIYCEQRSPEALERLRQLERDAVVLREAKMVLALRAASAGELEAEDVNGTFYFLPDNLLVRRRGTLGESAREALAAHEEERRTGVAVKRWTRLGF